MNVKLVVASGNPFELYPQLQTIWPEPYNSIAHEVSSEDSYTGQIYYITLDDKVVGVTGVFVVESNLVDIYLRWTGIIPGLRKGGVVRNALEILVKDVCPKHFPDRHTLIELVPDNDYGKTIVEPFFQKVGFNKYGPLERYDWVDHNWQPYILNFKE